MLFVPIVSIKLLTTVGQHCTCCTVSVGPTALWRLWRKETWIFNAIVYCVL